jgi:hypothetical protein
LADWDLTDHIMTEEVLDVVADTKSRQCMKFQHLHRAQHPLFLLANRKTVIMKRPAI